MESPQGLLTFMTAASSQINTILNKKTEIHTKHEKPKRKRQLELIETKRYNNSSKKTKLSGGSSVRDFYPTPPSTPVSPDAAIPCSRAGSNEISLTLSHRKRLQLYNRREGKHIVLSHSPCYHVESVKENRYSSDNQIHSLTHDILMHRQAKYQKSFFGNDNHDVFIVPSLESDFADLSDCFLLQEVMSPRELSKYLA